MKFVALTTFLMATAFAEDQKIQLQDMPPAVQQAVKEQSRGAVVRGYSKEVENGKTFYEAELTVNGHAKDVSFDEKGKMVAVEEVVALESIPEPARAAILKAAGSGTVKKVELVTENGNTSYEAAISKNGKTSERKVDAAGKTVN